VQQQETSRRYDVPRLQPLDNGRSGEG
jgi:hypothetical protein